MAEFSYEVVEDFGIIGEPTPSGWETRIRLISWNGREPKYDIRPWSPDSEKMGKGLTFSRQEFLELNSILYEIFDEESEG